MLARSALVGQSPCAAMRRHRRAMHGRAGPPTGARVGCERDTDLLLRALEPAILLAEAARTQPQVLAFVVRGARVGDSLPARDECQFDDDPERRGRRSRPPREPVWAGPLPPGSPFASARPTLLPWLAMADPSPALASEQARPRKKEGLALAPSTAFDRTTSSSIPIQGRCPRRRARAQAFSSSSPALRGALSSSG